MVYTRRSTNSNDEGMTNIFQRMPLGFWGAQAASVSLPAALPATSLAHALLKRRYFRSRQAAETYRLAACAPQTILPETHALSITDLSAVAHGSTSLYAKAAPQRRRITSLRLPITRLRPARGGTMAGKLWESRPRRHRRMRTRYRSGSRSSRRWSGGGGRGGCWSCGRGCRRCSGSCGSRSCRRCSSRGGRGRALRHGVDGS